MKSVVPFSFRRVCVIRGSPNKSPGWVLCEWVKGVQGMVRWQGRPGVCLDPPGPAEGMVVLRLRDFMFS